MTNQSSCTCDIDDGVTVITEDCKVHGRGSIYWMKMTREAIDLDVYGERP